MSCAMHKITSSWKYHSPSVFHQSYIARFSPSNFVVAAVQIPPSLCGTKYVTHRWMGDEVTTQIIHSWLINVSVSLQTPSPFSSSLLACSVWKGFVMEDTHGKEGSEGHCNHLLGRPPQRATNQQPQCAANQVMHICTQSSPTLWGYGVQDLCLGLKQQQQEDGANKRWANIVLDVLCAVLRLRHAILPTYIAVPTQLWKRPWLLALLLQHCIFILN